MKTVFGTITLLTGIGVLVLGVYGLVEGKGLEAGIAIFFIVIGFLVAITGMKVLQN